MAHRSASSNAKPRRINPPRAVSSSPKVTRLSRKTRRAPPGPDQSPASTISSPTRTQSVEQIPGTRPARVTIDDSSRTVVDFPLVPVTTTCGMLCTSLQATSCGSGIAVTGQVIDPSPIPMEACSSSDKKQAPRTSASARRAKSWGLASSAISMAMRSQTVSKAGPLRGCPASSATAVSRAYSAMLVAA